MKSIFSLFVAFLLVLVTFDEALAKGSSGGRGGFSSSRSSSSFSSSRSSYSSYSSSRSSSSSTSSRNAFSKSSTQSYTTPKWAAPAPKVVPVPKPTPTPKFVTTKTVTTSPGITTTRKVTTVSSSKPVPLSNPTSVVTSMREKCQRDRLPYSYCKSRGYWHPDQDRYAHNDSGSGAVAAGIATGVAVGALLSSNSSNAAPSQTVVVQAAPTAPGVVSTPVTTTTTQPQPLIKPFPLINDCSDWVCK